MDAAPNSKAMHLNALNHIAGTGDGIESLATTCFFAYCALFSNFEASGTCYLSSTSTLILLWFLDRRLVGFGCNLTVSTFGVGSLTCTTRWHITTCDSGAL